MVRTALLVFVLMVGEICVPLSAYKLNRPGALCSNAQLLINHVRPSLPVLFGNEPRQNMPSPTAAFKDKTGPISLFVLLLVFTANQWSRQVVYYMADFSINQNAFSHMNVDIGFSKDAYTLYSSALFAVVFAAVSIIAGQISDRMNRAKVIALACFTWSAATALQATSTSITELLTLRSIVAASQAFFNPAAFTLLAEVANANMLGGLNSILSTGIFLGGGAASLSLLSVKGFGWRQTLVWIGAVGVLVAAASAVLLVDPRSQATPSTGRIVQERNSDGQNTNKVLTDAVKVLESREARLLFTASALRFCAGFSIIVWKAPLVFAKFPGEVETFADSNAAIIALGGLTSSLLGGYLSDRIAGGRTPRARAWVPALGSLLAAPLWAAFVFARTPQEAAGFLLLEYVAAECWFGPTTASIFSAVPVQSRGTAQGLLSVLTALANLAPVGVGILADVLRNEDGIPGAVGAVEPGALAAALALVVCGAYVGAAGLFFLAAREAELRNCQA